MNRIPYHRAWKTNVKFSIVCSYLGKIIIRQFRSVPYIIVTVDLIYFNEKEN